MAERIWMIKYFKANDNMKRLILLRNHSTKRSKNFFFLGGGRGAGGGRGGGEFAGRIGAIVLNKTLNKEDLCDLKPILGGQTTFR